jgi:proteasome lid subunit RPN8/RPN11
MGAESIPGPNPAGRRPPGVKFRVSESLVAGLRRLALRRRPFETGGFLYAAGDPESGSTIVSFQELRTVRPSGTHYHANACEVREEVIRRARGRVSLAGMFHTHVTAVASPSSLDSRTAASGYVHAIATAGPSRPHVRFFHREGPDGPMIELSPALDITEECLRSHGRGPIPR